MSVRRSPVIYFLDTSVLVKRYVTEKGSEQIRRLLRRDVEIAVARITEGEAHAAIARAARMNVLTHEDRNRAFEQIAEDVASARVIEIRRSVVSAVRDLVLRWPLLRGYDAIQLSCALRLQSENLAVSFWCADDELANAARGEGMRVTVV
jgi:predicted nucleic acid-binding protein